MKKDNKKTKDITIVTAFFDISRSNIKGFKRTNKNYVDAFEVWGKIRNKLVVFSDKDTLEQVKSIREKYGLLEKTKLVEINDYINIDKELYSKIEKVMKNPYYVDFHLQKNIPEVVSAKYNYIMALKSWCCNYAVTNHLIDENNMVAWVDFGFNIGNKFYEKSDEFDFLWEYNFSEKIHLMNINKIDDLPAYEILRRNNTYIQGGTIIAPDYMWNKLNENLRKNMMALLDFGLTDDDQIFYLICYQQNPNIFELHDCNWNEVFAKLSDTKLTYSLPKQNKIYNFLYKLKHPDEFIFIRRVLYSFRTYKVLKKSKFIG